MSLINDYQKSVQNSQDSDRVSVPPVLLQNTKKKGSKPVLPILATIIIVLVGMGLFATKNAKHEIANNDTEQATRQIPDKREAQKKKTEELPNKTVSQIANTAPSNSRVESEKTRANSLNVNSTPARQSSLPVPTNGNLNNQEHTNNKSVAASIVKKELKNIQPDVTAFKREQVIEKKSPEPSRGPKPTLNKEETRNSRIAKKHTGDIQSNAIPKTQATIIAEVSNTEIQNTKQNNENTKLLNAILTELKTINNSSTDSEKLNTPKERSTSYHEATKKQEKQATEPKEPTATSFVANTPNQDSKKQTSLMVVQSKSVGNKQATPTVTKTAPPAKTDINKKSVQGKPGSNINRLYQAAIISHSDNLLREAESYYKQVIALAPDYKDAAINLSAVYLDMGKTGHATVILDQLLTKDPTNSKALVNRGIIAIESKDYSLARTTFEKALFNNPQEESALTNLSYLSQEEGDIKAQEKYILRLLQINPRNTETRLGYASLLEKTDRLIEAIKEYEYCLEYTNSQKDTELRRSIKHRIKILENL